MILVLIRIYYNIAETQIRNNTERKLQTVLTAMKIFTQNSHSYSLILKEFQVLKDMTI